MPRFGQIWFNGYYFSDDVPTYTPFKKSIHRVPLGFRVRKQIGHKWIFRVRRGNGIMGSTLGFPHQDKYKYFVPASINNPEGQAARDALKEAVLNWQTVLTTEQKAAYNKRAQKPREMSGYNLYIQEYIRANT